MTMLSDDGSQAQQSATWWVIGGMTLIAPGAGLMATFTPTRLKLLEFSEAEIGIVVTAFSVGLIAGCFFGGPLVRRIGHIRALALLCCLGGLSIMAMSVTPSTPLWSVCRALTGFCGTGIFVAAQSWLNEISPSDRRGRVLSTFYVLYVIGIGAGSAIVGVIDLDSTAAYLAGAAFYVVAVLPFAFTPAPTPPPPEHASIDLKTAMRISPLGLLGSAVAGAMTMAFYGVGPVYGLLQGFSAAEVAVLMALAPAGNLFVQLPFGFVSDRLDRRAVLLVVSVGGLLAATLIGVLDLRAIGGLVLVVGLFALLAGCMETIYSVSAAHANDRAVPGQHVSLAGTLLFAWSLGAFAGPAAGTIFLATLEPGSLFLMFAAACLIFGLFILWRFTQRATPVDALQEDFVVVSATAPIQAHPDAYVEELADSAEDNAPAGDERKG